MQLTVKNWFRKTLVFVTALLALQTAFANSPKELTQQVANQLFQDLKANQGVIRSNPDQLKIIVRKDLMPYVHVKRAGTLVLGQFFKGTTPAQQEAFFKAFDKFIEQQYAQTLTFYSNQELQIGKETTISATLTKVEVKLIQQNNQPATNLVFHWYKNSRTGQWQVYDMEAEGVSMIKTKNEEWKGILRKEGIEGLTTRVQQVANTPITFGK